jgi:hypothetical protein
MEFTQGIKSPPRYRRWAAVSAVAAALQRKVRIRIEGQWQYPNMYVLLVGPPGVGKGNAVKPMQHIIRSMGGIRLTPRGLSKRAFYDEMQAAEITDVDPDTGEVKVSSALTSVIEEFGVFLLPRDYEFMDALADVYDNPEVWDYKTRHAGESKAKNPTFNMIACSTPKGLKERFTDDIFEMGLPARITMIYADEQIEVPLFLERKELPKLEADLTHDLEQIGLMEFTYCWCNETADELDVWVKGGMKPIPLDPRFAHYRARRLAHLTKLCMIAAAAEHDDPMIYPGDLEIAKSILLEAETVMIGAIKAIGANPLKAQVRATKRFVEVNYGASGKPVPEFKLLRFMYSEVPLQFVDMIIEGLIKSVQIRSTGEPPTRLFTPIDPESKKEED